MNLLEKRKKMERQKFQNSVKIDLHFEITWNKNDFEDEWPSDDELIKALVNTISSKHVVSVDALKKMNTDGIHLVSSYKILIK